MRHRKNHHSSPLPMASPFIPMADVGLSGNWRTDAMNEALIARDTRTAKIMHAVSHRMKNPSQLLFVAQRSRLLVFLHDHCQAQSLLSGRFHYGQQDESEEEFAHFATYMGWYRVVWRSHNLEVVFLPGTHSNDGALCVGEDDEIVRDFVQSVQRETRRPLTRAQRYSYEWEDAPDFDAEAEK